jgi:phosphohistidine phosphatase
MPRVHHQAAVVPYRIRKERVEVALVTTSRGKKWIVPKGSVDEGERPRAAAIR